MIIGIDLLWVRPGKNGGTESVVRNILDGFNQYAPQDYYFILYVTKYNVETFIKYKMNDHFKLHVCECESNNQIKRVLWETVHLNSLGMKDKIDLWYYPVYSRPFFNNGKIPNVTVIHDLQAIHYPEYFSKFRNRFFKLAWEQDCKNSTEVFTISNFCKKDILDNYKISADKVKVIYNPINSAGSATDFPTLEERYGIHSNAYYYTVCSLAKHKNLLTLLKAIKVIKNKDKNVKLVVSGVKVNAEDEVFDYINNNDLSENIIYTGFISDEDRNSLYDHCYKFVFPSVFEGFGMPPIEALLRGKNVITTQKASLGEVTLGLCDYVTNPFDADEWAKMMMSDSCRTLKENEKKLLLDKYSLKNIIIQYLSEFSNIVANK